MESDNTNRPNFQDLIDDMVSDPEKAPNITQNFSNYIANNKPAIQNSAVKIVEDFNEFSPEGQRVIRDFATEVLDSAGIYQTPSNKLYMQFRKKEITEVEMKHHLRCHHHHRR